MKNIFFYITTASVLIFTSCKKTGIIDDSNSNIVYPINGLILNVQGADYTAVPVLTAPGKLNDTLEIKVSIPDVSATVKQLTLAETGATTTVAVNSVLTFINDVAEIEVKPASGIAHKYYVKMNYAPPPVMYFIKTSDKDANGVKYFLNTANAQKIASGTYNNKFEGYIDLSTSAWDNIGLINSNLTDYYEYNGGWYPEQSSGSFTLTPQTNPGGAYYPCAGPWADWTWKNSNAAIVSPGYWKLNYDATTMKLDLLETQWAIKGTATGNTIALTYNPSTKLWGNSTASLSAGSFKFITIPVTEGDPVVGYGDASASTASGKLSATGAEITVAAAGSYKISLNFSTPPNYTYTVVKN